MINSVSSPNMLEGIPDTFMPLKYTDGAGPIIVAVERSAIHYDPPGTAPETEAEWEAVTRSIWETLRPVIPKLNRCHDRARSASGVFWRHLDLTAEVLAESGVELRTMAHHMLRHSPGYFRPAS